MNKATVYITALLLAAGASHAADPAFTPYSVEIESVAVIATAVGQHKPGNVEVKIRGGLPGTAPCTDKQYVTTPASADPDQHLLGMLLRFPEHPRATIRVRPSRKASDPGFKDDPYLGYPGRCSIALMSWQF